MLNGNMLRELPESFFSFVLNNPVDPDSAASTTLSRNIRIQNNKLETLPEIPTNCHIIGDLDASKNQLLSLSDSFGALHVAGSLDLRDNKVLTFVVVVIV